MASIQAKATIFPIDSAPETTEDAEIIVITLARGAIEVEALAGAGVVVARISLSRQQANRLLIQLADATNVP